MTVIIEDRCGLSVGTVQVPRRLALQQKILRDKTHSGALLRSPIAHWPHSSGLEALRDLPLREMQPQLRPRQQFFHRWAKPARLTRHKPRKRASTPVARYGAPQPAEWR